MIFASNNHIGLIKKENQDQIKYTKTNNGSLFIVCDGLGGLPNGGIASKLCIDNIPSYFAGEIQNPEDIIKKSILNAHKIITKYSSQMIGSTLALTYIENNSVFAAWCGDSRIYHIRNKDIIWMSRDHTVLHDILNRGLGEKKHLQSPNAITRFLGNKKNHNPDIHTFKIIKNDIVLVCSDGLHNFLMEPQIINALCSNSAKKASKIMEVELLNNNLNAPDNFSWYIINI